MTLELTKQLIQQSSITPEDGKCQQIIAQRLQKIGFEISLFPFGEVKNLWARRGHGNPLFVFAGHTDIVPPGDLSKWKFPPFEPTEHEGYLYGRGAQDMKSNIAAMVTAVEIFIQKNPNHKGSIGFLITSDEEGPSINGTQKVIEALKSQQIHIDYCIVGEPSSQEIVGDKLKVGRRGTLSADLILHGKQGHIAYPHLALNPIHKAAKILNEMINFDWDEGKSQENFQKTSFQVSNIHAGTGATNVIPNDLTLQCNFRYSPVTTAEALKKQFENILQINDIRYSIIWHHSGNPFLTQKGKLLEACVSAIQKLQHLEPTLSTDGGTSDGRFIAGPNTEVIELGVCNDTIHQINERVKISELETLSSVYQEILGNLLIPGE